MSGENINYGRENGRLEIKYGVGGKDARRRRWGPRSQGSKVRGRRRIDPVSRTGQDGKGQRAFYGTSTRADSLSVPRAPVKPFGGQEGEIENPEPALRGDRHIRAKGFDG